jgi:hypothetical protein
VPAASHLWRVEDLEELGQPSPQIGTVRARARFKEIKEDAAWLKYACVVSEKAEDEPDEGEIPVRPTSVTTDKEKGAENVSPSLDVST